MYKGYIEKTPTETELALLYQDMTNNIFDCYVNEYVIVYNDAHEVIDKIRWNGERYERVNYKIIDNDYVGKIKPRNVHQELALNMLQNNEVTVKAITGRFGAGKDFLMISNALQLIKDNVYDKFIWVRNNQEVKDSKTLGSLPGEAFDKLLPFAMVIADHVGGKDGLEMLVNKNKVEIEHLGFIRGRDFKRSIIMCSEAENLTKQHVQLLIGRVGEGSALWLNGDFKQTDAKVFEENSGLFAAIDKLKGHPRFGYVNLEKSERSETAAMADLLD